MWKRHRTFSMYGLKVRSTALRSFAFVCFSTNSATRLPSLVCTLSRKKNKKNKNMNKKMRFFPAVVVWLIGCFHHVASWAPTTQHARTFPRRGPLLGQSFRPGPPRQRGADSPAEPHGSCGACKSLQETRAACACARELMQAMTTSTCTLYRGRASTNLSP